MTLSIEKPTPVRSRDQLEVIRGLTASWRGDHRRTRRAGGSAPAEREDLRASGLLSPNLPTRFGGWGADWPTTLEVVREIAEVDGSLAHLYGYHVGNVQFPDLLGTREQADRYQRRIAEQDLWTGNASSEANSNVPHWTVTATPTGDGGYLLNGRKHFTSGAKGSDLLMFGVLTDDAHPEGTVVSAIIPTDRAGATVNDDWDAIGQRRIDSGTTDFHDARIEADEVLGARTPWCGRSPSRPGRACGPRRPSSPSPTCTWELQTVWEAGDAVTRAQRGELMARVAGAKALATRVSLDVTGRMFEVIGARGTHPRHGFDRFWRNVGTHTLRDPVSHKINEMGRYVLNGTYPTPSFYS